ncbi:MAG: tRNA (N(6)-L-threonylcarbamoyladenosine(37)-C(2))-methylthiotransferase MtaB [Desulfobulbaceae bacterium]|nr:tRNA (N(6)-L-threonylcarbamoyladenosine(37)-C(2))-methylthiotransferase MtaB [Desulfobulbaceae bacterium]
MKKIAVTTLGCKVNQYESASFISSLAEAGCEMVPFSSRADIYIINTCAVTGRAGQQSRQLVRRALKTNPGARLIVTGCYAQMEPQQILDITDSRLCIVGNGNKHLLVAEVMNENASDLTMLMGNINRKREITPMPVRRFSGRTRAFLRIQDGCNNFCSYCIVPYTRGRSRSLPAGDVLCQAAVFAAEGYREIVITGINVGKYGADLKEKENICSLLARLCRDFPAIRFRLSSIEPTEIDDTLLDLIATRANFMPHLHIPLQSGDDNILKKMNRRYTVEQYALVLERIREALPEAAVGCDILCGFPGEDEEAHENTYRLIRDLPVTYLHVFPYSRRAGTLAASMKNQLPNQMKEERVGRLRALDKIKRESFYARFIGSRQQVLVEKREKNTQYLQGFSENYIPVRCDSSGHQAGDIIAVHIDGLADGMLFGSASKS